jgi:hypothetical protein
LLRLPPLATKVTGLYLELCEREGDTLFLTRDPADIQNLHRIAGQFLNRSRFSLPQTDLEKP